MHALWLAAIVGLALLGCSGAGPRPAPRLHNIPTGTAAPDRSSYPRGAITEEAITRYFTWRFPAQVEAGTLRLDYGSSGVAEQIIEELAALGIDDMRDLDRIVPHDLESRGFDALAATGDGGTNIAGLMRDLMIMHDTHAYFTTAWQHHWSTTGPSDFPIPAAYGVDFSLMRRLGVFDGD